mmetsp:Transcript_14805/g.22394  ORF Transcript_14805/g.22394 Transcript_14805/m.22394 type:complete len:100 (+) Transcript_14805:264-563(+)
MAEEIDFDDIPGMYDDGSGCPCAIKKCPGCPGTLCVGCKCGPCKCHICCAFPCPCCGPNWYGFPFPGMCFKVEENGIRYMGCCAAKKIEGAPETATIER